MQQSDPINLKMAYFRRRAGLTQVALGEKIGRKCSVQQFEEGRTKRLGAGDVAKWLKAVDASPEERGSIARQWFAEMPSPTGMRDDAGEVILRRWAKVADV